MEEFTCMNCNDVFEEKFENSGIQVIKGIKKKIVSIPICYQCRFLKLFNFEMIENNLKNQGFRGKAIKQIRERLESYEEHIQKSQATYDKVMKQRSEIENLKLN